MKWPLPIVRVTLVQATPKHGQDGPNRPGEHRAGEEHLEGGIGDDGDGAKGGREDEHGKRGVIRRGCAPRDAAEPGVPQEDLITAVGEEDADELQERISLKIWGPTVSYRRRLTNATARHLANKVDREQNNAAGDSQHLAYQYAKRLPEGIPRQ